MKTINLTNKQQQYLYMGGITTAQAMGLKKGDKIVWMLAAGDVVVRKA